MAKLIFKPNTADLIALVNDLKSRSPQAMQSGRIKSAIELLSDTKSDLSNDEIKSQIYKGLSLLYHPDKNNDPQYIKFFQLITNIKDAENYTALMEQIRRQLNPAVLPPRNPAPLPPQAAKYYYPPSKNNDMWADFNKKDQEDREKAKKEYLEKLRRQQAAQEKKSTNQSHQYTGYTGFGKQSFFEQVKKEGMEKLKKQAEAQATNQYRNDYKENSILSELDQTITGINNIYIQTQVHNDINIKMNIYNKILSDCSYAITSIHNIQLGSLALKYNPALQQRLTTFETIQFNIKQEQLNLQRQQEIRKAQELYRENKFKKQQEESYRNQPPKTLKDIIDRMKDIHKQMIQSNNHQNINTLYHQAERIHQYAPGIIKSIPETSRHTYEVAEQRAIITENWETIDKLYKQFEQPRRRPW